MEKTNFPTEEIDFRPQHTNNCSKSAPTNHQQQTDNHLHGRHAIQVQEGQHIRHQPLQKVKQPLPCLLAEQRHKEGGLAPDLHTTGRVAVGGSWRWWVTVGGGGGRQQIRWGAAGRRHRAG